MVRRTGGLEIYKKHPGISILAAFFVRAFAVGVEEAEVKNHKYENVRRLLIVNDLLHIM